jgi:hypothetical protein
VALLAESLVDEWLNRSGFFTIRGIKHGVGEIDLLGVKQAGNSLVGWHVEVQASFRPIGYIAPLSKVDMKGFASSRTSMKNRTPKLIETAAHAWVDKKYLSQAKRQIRELAWPGIKQWKYLLVHAVVKEPFELQCIAARGIEIVPLHKVLADLGSSKNAGIKGGAGTDLSEVVEYFYGYTRRMK